MPSLHEHIDELCRAVACEDALADMEVDEACSRAAEVAKATRHVGRARATFRRLAALSPYSEDLRRSMVIQAYVNAWCASKRTTSAMSLAEEADEWEVRPSDEIQRALCEEVLASASSRAPHRSLALVWASLFVEPHQLNRRAQANLVDITCSPDSPREDRHCASVALRRMARWQRQTESRLVWWLTCLPRSKWPTEVLLSAAAADSRIWENLASDLRERVDACVLGSSPTCVRDLRPRPNEMFVAHPFADRISLPLRAALSRLAECAPGLAVTYADKSTEDGTLACSICLPIRCAGLVLVDLTPECAAADGALCPKAKANPNVAFELGLALARGKRTILLSKRGCQPLSDINNHRRLEFDDYDDLPDLLKDRVLAAMRRRSV